MQVAILCGGLGTRLQEETVFKPKPMVEIGHKPILWHLMRYYACFGHERFLLCTGYKGNIIQDYFLNYRNRSSDIEVDLGDASVSVLSNADDQPRWPSWRSCSPRRGGAGQRYVHSPRIRSSRKPCWRSTAHTPRPSSGGTHAGRSTLPSTRQPSGTERMARGATCGN